MAFVFSDNCIIDATTFSNLIFGVTDASTDVNLALTQIQINNIQFIVNYTNDQILSYLDRRLLTGTYTEQQDSVNSDEILTREYPIQSISSIKFGYANDFSSNTAIPTNFYFISDRGISVPMHGTILPIGRGVVQIVYTAGYALADIPPSIQFALLEQYKINYTRFAPGESSATSQMLYDSASKMGESYTKNKKLSESGLSSDVIKMLEPHKRLDVPLSKMFVRMQ